MERHIASAFRIGLATALAAGALGGCARINDAGMRLVSSKASGYLIVNRQLLSGDVVLVPDRTGRLSFAAEQGAVRSCSGSLRYTATNAGEIDLRCNDGTQAGLQVTMLSETRGYGYAGTPQAPASIAFGMSMEDAQAFLTVPPGMALTLGTESGELELK